MNAPPSQQPHAQPKSTPENELGAFYQLEKAAADSYGKALSSILLRPFTGILESCHTSHEYRAYLLANRIRELGGEVPGTSGVWRSFVPLFEQAAAAINAKLAISLLEQNENHCLRGYRDKAAEMHPDTWSFVRDELLPRELGSHQAMSTLKHSLA